MHGKTKKSKIIEGTQVRRVTREKIKHLSQLSFVCLGDLSFINGQITKAICSLSKAFT